MGTELERRREASRLAHFWNTKSNGESSQSTRSKKKRRFSEADAVPLKAKRDSEPGKKKSRVSRLTTLSQYDDEDMMKEEEHKVD